MAVYYPWKVWILRDWLNTEVRRKRAESNSAKQSGISALAKDLQISDQVIWKWLINSSEFISLGELQAIARYRGTSVNDTVQWLGIRPAHFNEMVEASEPSTDALAVFSRTETPLSPLKREAALVGQLR